MYPIPLWNVEDNFCWGYSNIDGHFSVKFATCLHNGNNHLDHPKAMHMEWILALSTTHADKHRDRMSRGWTQRPQMACSLYSLIFSLSLQWTTWSNRIKYVRSNYTGKGGEKNSCGGVSYEEILWRNYRLVRLE